MLWVVEERGGDPGAFELGVMMASLSGRSTAAIDSGTALAFSLHQPRSTARLQRIGIRSELSRSGEMMAGALVGPDLYSLLLLTDHSHRKGDRFTNLVAL